MSIEQFSPDTGKADFARLKQAKLRLSRRYVLALLVPYFAFIAAIVVAPEALGVSLGGGGLFTLGLVASFLLIIAGVLLTGSYLRATERSIDPLEHEVRRGGDR